MSAKKNVRKDGTYLIEGGAVVNPKLYARKQSNGTESLYLEWYLGYKVVVSERTGKEVVLPQREKEVLDGLYLWTAPRTASERDHNKEVLKIAKGIQWEKSAQNSEQENGYRMKKKSREVSFYSFYEDYLRNYTKKDLRNIRLALVRFKSFLADSKKYSRYAEDIRPEQIDRDMILAFTEYLQEHSTGEGGLTLYKRFKKVIKYAVEHDVMVKNPCENISIRVDENSLTKDVLSIDEIKQLIQTHCKQENPVIRKAFIFCLNTGLRFCDVRELTFENVDYANKRLHFEQNKTRGHSKSSHVEIPLRDDLLSLIGKHEKDKSELLFPLPSHTMCLKALRHWVAKAGIDKHITWHCARHSFAVNILNNGANIKTVANLLGHAGLKHTEKYTRAVDKLKEEAINTLADISLE